MGTIAARDCLRVLELTEQVAAALVMAAAQAVELRMRDDAPGLTDSCAAFCEDVRRHVAFLDEDRPLENDLRLMINLIRERTWRLYD